MKHWTHRVKKLSCNCWVSWNRKHKLWKIKCVSGFFDFSVDSAYNLIKTYYIFRWIWVSLSLLVCDKNNAFCVCIQCTCTTLGIRRPLFQKKVRHTENHEKFLDRICAEKRPTGSDASSLFLISKIGGNCTFTL